MFETSFAFLEDWCERPGAKRNELAVESFFSHSYTVLKQRVISETVDLHDVAYGIFFILFLTL